MMVEHLVLRLKVSLTKNGVFERMSATYCSKSVSDFDRIHLIQLKIELRHKSGVR